MAKAIAHNDIERGSSVVIGVADIRRSRAQRHAHVIGLTGDRTDPYEAAKYYREQHPTHPDMPYLPIREVRGSYWVPGEARVDASYGFGLSTPPPYDAFELADIRLIREQSRSTIVDLDSSDPLYDNGGEILVRKDLPVFQIRVFTVLDTNPEATVDAMYDQLNNDCVTINGRSRDINTLRFVGAEIRPIVAQADDSSDSDGKQIKYATNYVFHYLSQGWVGAGIYLNSVRTAGEPLWVLEERRAADWQETAFAEQFPVHANADASTTGPKAGSCS